jgi:hypothetical protein
MSTTKTMSQEKSINKEFNRRMGIDDQRTQWDRMVTKANITQADINEAKERKANQPKPIKQPNIYDDDEMRTYMVNECKRRVEDVVAEVKHKEKRLSTFSQITLNNIKEIVKLELKKNAIEQRNVNESTLTYDELEDEWYDEHLADDEKMEQWLEEVNGYRIDREVMLEVCREMGNYIKVQDAVNYINRKYDDDEQELLRQLKEVQERKIKVVELAEGMEQKRLEKQDAQHKEDIKNEYVEQMLLIK